MTQIYNIFSVSSELVLHDSVTIEMRPRNKETLPLGFQLEIDKDAITDVQLKRYIAADIKFFHKKQIVLNNIKIFYRDNQIGKGAVLNIMQQIDAMPTVS